MTRLEVITGPMFSGKSEELIRRLRRESYAEQNILVIRPRLDTRTPDKKIASRRKKDRKDEKFEESESFPAQEVGSAEEFIKLVQEQKPDVLAIDEAQLFSESIPNLPYLIDELLDKRDGSDFIIIASGLDLDAWRKPFGVMADIISIADPRFVLRLSAICFNCKKRPANLTHKIGGSSKQIEIDNGKIYEARCWHCHKIPE